MNNIGIIIFRNFNVVHEKKKKRMARGKVPERANLRESNTQGPSLFLFQS